MNIHYIFSIPEEWMALGMIDGEQYPCPGVAYIPKDDTKLGGIAKNFGNVIQTLNGLYEVGV